MHTYSLKKNHNVNAMELLLSSSGVLQPLPSWYIERVDSTF